MAKSRTLPAPPSSPPQPPPSLLLALPGVEADPLLAVALAALLSAGDQGHTGMSIAGLAEACGCPPEVLRSTLLRSLASSGLADRPLVVLDDWVTSRRTWQHELALAQDLRVRAQRPGPCVDEAVAQDIARWFPAQDRDLERQRLAVATAMSRGLTLITGGPGRGKTHVAGAIVACLHAQRLRAGLPIPTVCLCAPTGKAAARLHESITAALARAATQGHPGMTSAQARQLSGWTSTLHRLFHDRRRAQIDLIIIDEMSMATAAMLHRALAGVRTDAQVVLLGDADQLASVEAGRVLADLAELAGPAPASDLAGWYAQHWPHDRLPDMSVSTADPAGRKGWHRPQDTLPATRVALVVNHRSAGTPVAQLADACQAPDPGPAIATLLARGVTAQDGEGSWVARCDPPGPRALVERLCEHGIRTITAMTGSPALSQARAGQLGWLVLSCLRQGPYGALALNAALERHLAATGLISPDEQGHYAGRPVLVTGNQRDLDLANGDLGLLWPAEADAQAPHAGRTLWRLVLAGEGPMRSIPIQRVECWEPAWVMTVHKAQGSQAPQVEIIGPGPQQGSHALLTRELLYTAITRAQERVRLWLSDEQVHSAAAQATRRSAGLALALADGDAGAPPGRQ